MKKQVHRKFLALASVAFGFVANAQLVVNENFQGFTEQGWSGAFGGCDASTNKPAEGTISVTSGGVTYTLENTAVAPACTVKGGTNATITKVGSDGYLELGKYADNTNTNKPGIVIVSKQAAIGTVTFNASFTGGNRATGSLRHGELYYSTDDGANWTQVDVDANGDDARIVNSDPAQLTFVGDVYGGIYKATINAENAMLKFASPSDATGQRFRIHDLQVDNVVSVNDLFLNGSASVSVEGNSISISSTENGTVEVLNINGSSMGSKNISTAASENFTVSSGMYLVKLVTDNKISVKKVLVQ